MIEDSLFWVLVLPGLLLGTYAQWRIKANVAKYSQIRTKDGITGAEVARRLLDSRGLQGVKVEATPGMLTDHYDPRTKILRLSQGKNEVHAAPLADGYCGAAVVALASVFGTLKLSGWWCGSGIFVVVLGSAFDPKADFHISTGEGFWTRGSRWG